MQKSLGKPFLAITLLYVLAMCAVAQEPQAPEAPSAPVPPQLVNAKRAFVANGTGDSDPAIARYTNGTDGLYNQLYADLKALGRYELVASPGDADVVLELEIDYAVFNHAFTYPKLRLAVRDPKTNVLLWTFSEPIQGALFVKSGRKNIAHALSKLTDDLKRAGTSTP